MVELEANVLINASFLPNAELGEVIKSLEENQAVFYKDDVIAFYAKDTQEDIDWLVRKLLGLRIFSDEEGRFPFLVEA